jgi:hypothetical protein
VVGYPEVMFSLTVCAGVDQLVISGLAVTIPESSVEDLSDRRLLEGGPHWSVIAFPGSSRALSIWVLEHSLPSFLMQFEE